MRIILGNTIEYSSFWQFFLECIALALVIVGYYMYMGIVAVGEWTLYLISRIHIRRRKRPPSHVMTADSDEELIIHNCNTCLEELTCNNAPYGNEDSPCKDFIPEDWQDHIYSNGDWIRNR